MRRSCGLLASSIDLTSSGTAVVLPNAAPLPVLQLPSAAAAARAGDAPRWPPAAACPGVLWPLLPAPAVGDSEADEGRLLHCALPLRSMPRMPAANGNVTDGMPENAPAAGPPRSAASNAATAAAASPPAAVCCRWLEVPGRGGSPAGADVVDAIAGAYGGAGACTCKEAARRAATPDTGCGREGAAAVLLLPAAAAAAMSVVLAPGRGGGQW